MLTLRLPKSKIMLRSVCYISNAHALWEADKLKAFFEFVAKKNETMDITGLLLYNEGTFVQLLEGEDTTIETILTKIKKDERHNQLTVMIDQPIKHRLFKKYKTSPKASGNDIELQKLRSRVHLPKASQYAKSLWAVLRAFYISRQTNLYGSGI